MKFDRSCRRAWERMSLVPPDTIEKRMSVQFCILNRGVRWVAERSIKIAMLPITSPIKPGGAVSTTIHMREKFCSCSISDGSFASISLSNGWICCVTDTPCYQFLHSAITT